VQRALERYRSDKIDVQDVSVNVRVLSAPSVPSRAAEAARQIPNESRTSGPRAAGGRGMAPERRDRGRGVMETNHLPTLETIDYPSDSLGRHGEIVRRQKYPRRLSESGKSDRSAERSRASSRGSNNRRGMNGS
jgi:hypothetical protein